MVSAERSDIQRAVVEVTRDCNNACTHCYNYWRGREQSGHEHSQLSRLHILQLVRKVKRDTPLTQVALSGGEPLLREDLAGIVCDLAEEDISPVVITNGTLLTSSRLQEFPEGTVFEVTLFGASADLHNQIAGNSVFDDVLEGLLNLEKHKCRLILVAVITKLNVHDVGRTIELGIALGATAVLLNRVNLSRHMLPAVDRVVPSVPLLRQGLDAAQQSVVKYGIPVAISVPVPPCLVDPEDYPSLHFGWCPRGGKDSYYTIGCEGFLRPCNHSSVILGDLKTCSFGEIVSGHKAREFWSMVPDECLECGHPLKDVCAGGCPAAADECYGSPRRRDPFVEYASIVAWA